jgi:predicted RNA polymerase sigma factor
VPRFLGSIARRVGDFAAAEDAAREVLGRQHGKWPRDGLPDHAVIAERLASGR